MLSVILLLLVSLPAVHPIRNAERKDKIVDWDTAVSLTKSYLCTGNRRWVDEIPSSHGMDSHFLIVEEALKFIIQLECEKDLSSYQYAGMDQRFEKWFKERKVSTRSGIRECLGRQFVASAKWMFCCGYYSKQLLKTVILLFAQVSCEWHYDACHFARFMNTTTALDALFEIIESAELCECPEEIRAGRDRRQQPAVITKKRQFDLVSLIHVAKLVYCRTEEQGGMGVAVYETVTRIRQNPFHWLILLVRKPGCCLLVFDE